MRPLWRDLILKVWPALRSLGRKMGSEGPAPKNDEIINFT